MIHGDTHATNNTDSYQLQLYTDIQNSVDSFFGRDITEQASEDNHSLYAIDIGPFQNTEPVDLKSIDSADLLDLQGNESTITELLDSSIKMSVKTPENSSHSNSNVFPNLEEHDDAGYKFELNLNPNTTGKNYWYYSSKLQKVFIKLDQTFYIDALYSPKEINVQTQQLYLRAMMVFINDISSPVQRCHNHINSDLSSDAYLRQYILRCENSDTKYKGECEGRNVNDRLSILIPLNINQGRPNENNVFKHSIALKFVCQNSCIGRKQTAVIFTLENQNSCVLGKKVVNVKVCSCPKRDKQKDEEKFSLKRNNYDRSNDPPNKIPSVVKVKEEPAPSTSPLLNSSLADNSNNGDNFVEVKLTFNLPKNIAQDVVRCVFDKISGRMALDVDNTEKYRKYLKEAKKKLDEFGCTSCRYGSSLSN